MKNVLTLLGFIAACFLVAFIGSRFAPGAWYQALDKPSWNPPNWIFGPVWTLLYILIAVSGWLVWKEKGFEGATAALSLFGVQLVLNAAWSWLFFGLHRPGWALAEILVLWLSIALLTWMFWQIRPLAGALLLPYLAWVGFAAFLNGTIWRLNS